MDESFGKSKSKFEARGEDPTPDARWALWVDCMSELASAFFSLQRVSKRNDVKNVCVGAEARHWEKIGKFWETHGHLGDYSEQHLHARHILLNLSWQLRPMDKTVRCRSNNVIGIRATQSTAQGQMPRSPHIDTAAGRERHRGPQTSLLPPARISTRPRGDGSTHYDARAKGRMDAEVVDIGETEREFQADMPPLQPMDMTR